MESQRQSQMAALLGTWAMKRPRWLLLAHWTEQDIHELHRQEKSLSRQFSAAGAHIPNLELTESLNMRNGLNPFWSQKVLDFERTRRTEMFYAQIFKTWAPIVQRHMDRELNDKDRNAAADFREIDVLHECDLAVKASRHTVDRQRSEADNQHQERREQVTAAARSVYDHD